MSTYISKITPSSRGFDDSFELDPGPCPSPTSLIRNLTRMIVILVTMRFLKEEVFLHISSQKSRILESSSAVYTRFLCSARPLHCDFFPRYLRLTNFFFFFFSLISESNGMSNSVSPPRLGPFLSTSSPESVFLSAASLFDEAWPQTTLQRPRALLLFFLRYSLFPPDILGIRLIPILPARRPFASCVLSVPPPFSY